MAAEHESREYSYLNFNFGPGFADFWGLNDCIYPYVYI